MRPRFFLEERMGSDLLSPLIVVHEIIDDYFGDSSVLHDCNMVETLLIDGFRFDECQEVPLRQHSHLRDVTGLAQ